MRNSASIPTAIIPLVCFLFGACGPSRNITYLSNLGNTVETTSSKKEADLIIQPDDLLGISVTSLSVESNQLFSNGVDTTTPYLVDENGYVDFPLIGSTKLSGLTKIEAKNMLIQKLNEHVKQPIVGIRFMNFKVTVLGEVNNPSSFIIPNDNVNILEALGLAGDLTVFGKRENVLLIRERDNVRTTVRLNLNDKDILDSPYFWLQQNDIIYVEPDKARVAQADIKRSNLQFAIAIGTSVISIATLLLTRVF